MHPSTPALNLPTQPVLFEVGNNDISIWNATPDLQALLDHYTKYPTPVGIAQQGGWKPPESATGEDFWDGWVHLCRWTRSGPGRAPTGLLDLCLWVCERWGYPVQVNDLREKPEDNLPDLFEAVVDRDYQLEAVRVALEEGRGVLDMPPRSGKTRTMVEIHRRLALPTIWVAPTTNVVKQTVRVLNEFFGPHHAVSITGTKTWEQHKHTRVICCTAATASKLPGAFYATRQMLVIDEFHHAAARTYHDIALRCPHIFYRFGMTGTFFRSGEDALAMHAVLSKTIVKVTTEELISRGYLVPCDVAFIPVVGPKVKGGGTFAQSYGKSGIWQHKDRNELAAWATELCAFYGRKTLVLVSSKDQGYRILDMLENKFPPGTIDFVSSDKPKNICQETIDRFADPDSKLQVLLGTSMVGEGTDLPPASALVYACGMKAEVGLIQASFRVCTQQPGKPSRSIFIDFSDRHHKTLLAHSLERLRIFYEEPIFDVEVLDLAENLGAWVAQKAGS